MNTLHCDECRTEITEDELFEKSNVEWEDNIHGGGQIPEVDVSIPDDAHKVWTKRENIDVVGHGRKKKYKAKKTVYFHFPPAKRKQKA